MDTPKSTSSLASADGPTPSGSPDGQTTSPSGPAPVHVSRFRALDSGKAMPIDDISGPLFNTLSPSADLQRSLESRLRARLGANGSPLYVLTWREVDMPAGVPILRRRASGHRTSGSGSSGWPTPQSTNNENRQNLDRGGPNIGMLVGTTGWPTPDAGALNGPMSRRISRELEKLKAKTRINGNGAGPSCLRSWTTPHITTPTVESRTARAARERSTGGT